MTEELVHVDSGTTIGPQAIRSSAPVPVEIVIVVIGREEVCDPRQTLIRRWSHEQ